MRAASMFSGIGGAELALPEADWIWCAEIETFPSAVLAARFGHPNLGDITAEDFIDRARAMGPLDLLCGGPPCQAFSIAGLRNSMQDARKWTPDLAMEVVARNIEAGNAQAIADADKWMPRA